LLAVMLVVGFALADDEPPRLKKKVKPTDDGAAKKDEPKPKAEPKPDDKPRLPEKPKVEDEPDKTPPEPEIDEQEVLNRLAKDLRAAEERLGSKDLSEGTKQVQRDILKGLEDLIKASQNSSQPDQQDPSGGAGQQQQQQQQKQQQAKGSTEKRNNQTKGRNQRAERQARRNQRRQQMAGKNQQQGSQQEQNEQQQEQAGNNPGGGAKGQENDPNRNADLFKDIWGHLPYSMRAEMNAYGREKFMTKYEDLIKRYYDRAARESRRKGD
jgi:hypothetical protein